MAARTQDTERDEKRSFLPIVIGVIALGLIVAYMVFLSVTSGGDQKNEPAAPAAAAGHAYGKVLTRDEAIAAGMFKEDSLGTGTSVTVQRADWPGVVHAIQLGAASWESGANHPALIAATAIAERGNNLDNQLLDSAHPRDQLPSMSIEASREQWDATLAVIVEARAGVSSEAAPALDRSIATISAQLRK